MDDTSLDEFLDAGSEAEEDTPASESEQSEDGEIDSNGSADTPSTDTVDTETVEPATPTAMWAESGEYCDRCGEETQRLWTDGEAAVCRDCKAW